MAAQTPASLKAAGVLVQEVAKLRIRSPLPYRSMLSADAGACRGGPDAAVPRHGFARLYGMGTQAGITLAAADQGLDAEPVEPAAALHVALASDAGQRWLAGKPLFRPRDAATDGRGGAGIGT